MTYMPSRRQNPAQATTIVARTGCSHFQFVRAGLLLSLAGLLSGCVDLPVYDLSQLSPGSINASSETLPNTFPQVILTTNTQATCKFLDNPDYGIDLNSRALMNELEAALRTRFGNESDLINDGHNEGTPEIRVLFDARVYLGPIAGSQNVIYLTALLIDPQKNVIASIQAQGSEEQPSGLVGPAFRDAAATAFSNLAQSLNTSPELAAVERNLRASAQRSREAEAASELAQLADTSATAQEIFKLAPVEGATVSEATEALITWKDRHLDALLRSAKTEELQSDADQIEHTIFEATDASGREKDEAQRIIEGGSGDPSPHSDLARAYSLRIEVLKPILAAIKDEIANRSK
jgi:hypothetical protein